MSRVAKNPIEIIDGVTVNVNDGSIDVKGKVGELKFDLPQTVSLDITDNVITVKYDENNQQSVALAGTTRALVNNMIIGVSQGFEKKLELKGVGYRAKASGKLLELTLGQELIQEVFQMPLLYIQHLLIQVFFQNLEIRQ